MADIYCFGTGARSRWMQSSFTDRTSFIAARIAGNKMTTASILRRAGLPAPQHAPVASADDAVRIARELGYPVVVKPADRHQGVGVAAGLANDDVVRIAFAEASKKSTKIMVEKHFEGTDYRMIVLNGKLLRVRGRLPGGVIGDGEHTIAELVEIRRKAPENIRRERERGSQLLALDQEALALLAENGLTSNDIPASKQYVRLRRRGNVAAGGTSFTVEAADIHPDNRRMAERAVSLLRLDFGGLDVIIPDMGRSWMETGAIICEVNAQPQASSGILEILLDGEARIPLVLVVAEDSSLDQVALATRLPQNAGVAVASRSGIHFNGERLSDAGHAAPLAGEAVLGDLAVEAAVIVMTPSEIRELGLPSDQFDLVIFGKREAWRITNDKAAAALLAILLPHARKVVSAESDSGLLEFEEARQLSDAGRWEVSAATLPQACEDGLRAVLAEHPQSSRST
jgi:cyanophycin synthetase